MPEVTNEELVAKAVATTNDIATSGKLNPAQADKFIDYVIDITGLKNQARVVRFRNEQLDIDKMSVGKRVAMPAVEAVAPGIRRGITTSKVSLLPKETIVPFEISDSFREVNLEGESVEDHVIKMMATQYANDLETLYIGGDVNVPAAIEGDIVDGGSTTLFVRDAYLAMFDGWLKMGRSANIFDAGGANIGSSTFSRMLNALPAKFKRIKRDLRFFTSIELEQLMREKLSTRATSKGDSSLQDDEPISMFGVPVMPFPLFPFKPIITENIVLTGTTPTALLHAPISSVVAVLPITLDNTPTAAFSGATDYVADLTNGTIARVGGSTIGSGNTVKVQYAANPQIVLTHKNNLIIGIGRDIRIEKDRDIFKRVNQYAITSKVAVQYEELTAIVLGKNIGAGV